MITIYDAETDLLIGEAAQEGDAWVLRCRLGAYSVPKVSAPTFEGLLANIDDCQRIGAESLHSYTCTCDDGAPFEYLAAILSDEHGRVGVLQPAVAGHAEEEKKA